MKTKLSLILLTLLFVTNSFATSITSESLNDDNSIPANYTCDGKNISPELSWDGFPAEAKSAVMIMSDPDAPNGVFYHWIVYNIPNAINSFQAGLETLPAGASAAKNSWNKAQYNGPCPPKGSMHHYVFTIYALDSNIVLPVDSNATNVLNAIQTHILDQASMTATYERK